MVHHVSQVAYTSLKAALQSSWYFDEGLTANLISVSQLCDDGMKVFFIKDGCTVNNNGDQTIMKEVRSDENYYTWTSINALVSRKSVDAELWHKKLGHTNYRNIQQLYRKRLYEDCQFCRSRTECIENAMLGNIPRVITKRCNSYSPLVCWS
ncbi:hypothetical protein LIER_35917 [Lithospermum erythrorhizon]|uniref:GAG-pre-integrase domain-containing protein n=1 Tax=Lithospermum erythrorhizon TaxID=34254 RepID=A0AAV3NZ35_LITER